jgi:hypothetical protein
MHDDVWREIRALRAMPPIRSDARDKDKRCATFRAALRQAEELADAAAAAGYTTRALPLFYATEQAGLAIAAARSQEASSATSHGLKFHLDYRQKNILLGEIRADGNGAFQTVADATGSPAIVGAVKLGEIWAANPGPDRRAYPSTAWRVGPSYRSRAGDTAFTRRRRQLPQSRGRSRQHGRLGEAHRRPAGRNRRRNSAPARAVPVSARRSGIQGDSRRGQR